MTIPPLDVEACVRLLTRIAGAGDDLLPMATPGTRSRMQAENDLLRALASALRGMRKDSEPTVTEVIAWMQDRPGCSWTASIADVHEAVEAIRRARAAQPEETKP